MSSMKIYLKMLSPKYRPFGLCLIAFKVVKISVLVKMMTHLIEVAHSRNVVLPGLSKDCTRVRYDHWNTGKYPLNSWYRKLILQNTSKIMHLSVVDHRNLSRNEDTTTTTETTPNRFIFYALKTESHHDANFVVTGGTVGCLYDNLRCHQWRQSWHYDNSRFSVCDMLDVAFLPAVFHRISWCPSSRSNIDETITML